MEEQYPGGFVQTYVIMEWKKSALGHTTSSSLEILLPPNLEFIETLRVVSLLPCPCIGRGICWYVEGIIEIAPATLKNKNFIGFINIETSKSALVIDPDSLCYPQTCEEVWEHLVCQPSYGSALLHWCCI